MFEKGEFVCEGLLEAGTSSVEVSLHSRGNFDSRALPQLPDSKQASATFNVSSFEHRLEPETVKAFFRTELAARGWSEANDAWSTDQRFVQRGMECKILSFPGENGAATTVCFTAIRSSFDPAEVHAAMVSEVASSETERLTSRAAALATMDLGQLKRVSDFDPGSCSGVRLEYKAWAGVEQVMLHYEEIFRAGGWTPVTPYINLLDKGEANWVKDGCRVRLAIRTEESQTGLAYISLVNHGRFDARQLAFPPGAEIAAEPHLAHNSTLQFVAALTVEDTAKYYRNQLTVAGWKEPGDLHFTLGDQHLQLYLRDMGDGKTAVQLSTELE
jgi:hypothetical protein